MKPEIIKHPTVEITLKKDFYSSFQEIIKNLFDESGASYFAHQLIENYYLPGHRVSSFNSNENWLEVYWDKYWHCDPIERKGHKNAQSAGLSLTSWQVCDPTNECMEARTSMCDIRDGFLFAIQHSNGWLENYTLAWKKFNPSQMDMERINRIQALINPIRQAHRQSFSRPHADQAI